MMSPAGRLRTWLLWVALPVTLLATYITASLLAWRWALTTVARCSQPCQDLGLDVETPPTKYSFPIHHPRCAPLRLRLELYRPEARRDTRYALWHRLTVTNDSCYRLSDVQATDFIDSWETAAVFRRRPDASGLTLHVWGPDGKEIAPGNFPRGALPPSYLYDNDYGAITRLKKERRLTDAWDLTLNPGESFTTVPSILRPTREYPTSEMGADGYGLKPIPAPKDAVSPPSGYKILDSFLFSQQGRYTIQASFDTTVSAEVIRPHLGKLPNWLAWPAVKLWDWGIIDPPDPDIFFNSHKFRIHVESEKLEFAVPAP